MIINLEQNYNLLFVMNILSNMQEIANVVIRPSRYLYKTADLGPKCLLIYEKTVTRTDFEVKNQRGYTLKGSIFTSCPTLSQAKNIIIYLHCNSGCRIEAYMSIAIKSQFTYVVFDFCGSGNSQGKYVSLGFYEVEDLTTIIEHLKKIISPQIRIGLWGRSMGAVTALRYLCLNPNNTIIIGIFDSPFQSLKQLFLEIGSQKTKFPKLVLEVAYKYLKPIVQQKAKFNIDCVDLQIIKHIAIKCPGIFIASKNDSLIPFEQIDSIFKDYQAEKQMFFIEETHNQSRNLQFIKKVFKSVQKYFINHIQSQNSKQTNYYSFISRKNQQTTKQKLQLTIKSYSQKALLLQQPKNTNYHQCSHPTLEKKPISGMFARKNSTKLQQPKEKIQIEGDINRTSFHTKRKPISICKFFKDQPSNQNVIKFKPKIQWEKNINLNEPLIKLPKDKQRKTIEGLSKKRPPFSELKQSHELRVNLQPQTLND